MWSMDFIGIYDYDFKIIHKILLNGSNKQGEVF